MKSEKTKQRSASKYLNKAPDWADSIINTVTNFSGTVQKVTNYLPYWSFVIVLLSFYCLDLAFSYPTAFLPSLYFYIVILSFQIVLRIGLDWDEMLSKRIKESFIELILLVLGSLCIWFVFGLLSQV